MKNKYCWWTFEHPHTGEPTSDYVCPICAERYHDDPDLVPAVIQDRWTACSVCNISYQRYLDLTEVGK